MRIKTFMLLVCLCLTRGMAFADMSDEVAIITDVTAGRCQINVHGPKSRELLQRISGADLTNEGFPFMSAREIDVGYDIADHVAWKLCQGALLWVPSARES